MNNDFTKTMNYPFYLEELALFCAIFGLNTGDLTGYLLEDE